MLFIVLNPLRALWHFVLTLLIIGLLVALAVIIIKRFIHLRDERRNRTKLFKGIEAMSEIRAETETK